MSRIGVAGIDGGHLTSNKQSRMRPPATVGQTCSFGFGPGSCGVGARDCLIATASCAGSCVPLQALHARAFSRPTLVDQGLRWCRGEGRASRRPSDISDAGFCCWLLGIIATCNVCNESADTGME